LAFRNTASCAVVALVSTPTVTDNWFGLTLIVAVPNVETVEGGAESLLRFLSSAWVTVSVAFILGAGSWACVIFCPVVCACAVGIWLPATGVTINSANVSIHAINKPRPLVFVLRLSRGYFIVDKYYHIRASSALLAELYLFKETEFIRFFYLLEDKPRK
jgi:hypothetical protein